MEVKDRILSEEFAKYFSDPYGYVMFAFPWGEDGTPLAKEKGPDEWQTEVLKAIGKGVLNEESAIQLAVSSGHGIGKSALVAWIVLWAMSTRPHLSGVVTAGTKTQLETKTWREVAKWKKLSINGYWFNWTATKLYQTDHPETWFTACVPWREENPEAFAGQHEKPHNVLVLYDEASAVADNIWEVSEGAMTTDGAMWLVFGNPTKNSGRFKECFPSDGKFCHRWKTWRIDSRSCKLTNKKQIEQWKEDYGEDSDFFKIRVKGQFPSMGDAQFIPKDLVDGARARELELDVGAELTMGIDVARFGDDDSVIVLRQGRVMDPMIQRFHGLSTVELTNKCARIIDRNDPDAVMVDGMGIGGAVVDQLKALGYKVIDVQASETPEKRELYLNKRAELWGLMKDWLKIGSIPKDEKLFAELISMEYSYNRTDQIVLEAKKDLKKRGLPSPDTADALSLTFARTVRRRDRKRRPQKFAETEYKII